MSDDRARRCAETAHDAKDGPMRHVVELDTVAATPWRNGLGRTRELLTWRAGGAVDTWAVRVSVADIEADAPFSSFAGVDRAFAVLEGDGVELDVDGTTTRLRVGDPPLIFAGESSVRARLVGGPTRDLNLMVRRDAFAAILQHLDAGIPWRPGARLAGAYTHHPARCQLRDDGFDLPARSLLWFDRAPAVLSLRSTATGQPFNALGLGCAPPTHA